MKKYSILIYPFLLSCTVSNPFVTHCPTIDYTGPRMGEDFLVRNGVEVLHNDSAACSIHIDTMEMKQKKWNSKINHLTSIKINNQVINLVGTFTHDDFEYSFKKSYDRKSSLPKKIEEFPEVLGELLMDLTREIKNHSTNVADISPSTA